jgi:hypothetical protein
MGITLPVNSLSSAQGPPPHRRRSTQSPTSVHGSVRLPTGSTPSRLESSFQALDAVQDGVRGEAQVPVEVFVADGVVEGDGLRAFEGLVF